MPDQKPGQLSLGHLLDAQTGERTGSDLVYDARDLTTHGVIVGMTGSGKTGLGITLIEEALLSGIPVLVLDPKGDMGNLCLAFPDLAASDFAPWVNAGDAQRAGLSVDAFAARTATSWREGLAGSGIGPERIEALVSRSELTLYTPGSTAGVPLDIVGSLKAPPGDWSGQAEVVRDEVEGFVSSLLQLVGIAADPLASREHILLANLIEHAWSAGQDLDLATLIGQVPRPPLRKLGVFDLDAFFPEKDRMALAMRLNGLVAAPSFAAWTSGPALDIGAMLAPAGARTRAAIVYLAHLSDEERQFVVTLILGKVVTWLRGLPGTTDLRALVYMDEVFGFCPPTAAPPSKKPILTILKQARAYGVGMVLSTQNPVDLDYKAVANAGTWFVGRLQTERDKARIVEGLASARGDVDVPALDRTISALGKRQFLLQSAHLKAPVLFATRWAMSYLRGPLTRDQVANLAAGSPEKALAAGGPGPGVADAAAGAPLAGARSGAGSGGGSGAGSDGGSGAGSGAGSDAGSGAGSGAGSRAGSAAASRGGSGAGSDAGSGLGSGAGSGGAARAGAAARPDTGAGTAADESPIAPRVPARVPVYYLDPAAPWAADIGAARAARRLEAALVARVAMRYDDTAAGVDHLEEWEAVFMPLGPRFDPADARAVDYDARDFRDEPPGGAVYALPEAPVSEAAFYTAAERALKDHLYRNRAVEVPRNAALKLYGRVGEESEAFAARCEAAADDAADRETAALRDRYEARIQRAQAALRTAEAQVEQLEVDVSARKQQEMLSGAGDLLSAFLGGRGRTRSLVRSITRGSSRRSMTTRTEARKDAAEDKVAARQAEIEELEAELGAEITDIQDRWLARAAEIDTVRIPLEQSDVAVQELALVWVPVG